MKLIRVLGAGTSGRCGHPPKPSFSAREVRVTIAPSTRPPPTRAVSADPPGDVNGVSRREAWVLAGGCAGMGDRLAGKVTIVTGAGSGIGRASAIRFAEEGARVTCVDVNREAVEAVASEIGDQAFAVVADVSVAAQVKAYTDDTVARWGQLDVAFNNAGINIPGVFHEVPDEVVDRTLDVNVKGCIYGCRYAIPHMLARGRGSLDQHDVGQRPRGRALPGDLRHLEGGDRHAVEGHRARLREAGHPLQRARPRLGRHADQLRARRDARRPRRRSTRRSIPSSRSAGPANRARSPTSRCSSPPTSRRSSPAR